MSRFNLLLIANIFVLKTEFIYSWKSQGQDGQACSPEPFAPCSLYRSHENVLCDWQRVKDAVESVLLQILKVNIQISVLLDGQTTGVHKYYTLAGRITWQSLLTVSMILPPWDSKATLPLSTGTIRWHSSNTTVTNSKDLMGLPTRSQVSSRLEINRWMKTLRSLSSLKDEVRCPMEKHELWYGPP